ncbi:MAG: hypothetical protein ACFE85_07440 [Candidatus Hodarchaeota archaeon]
MKSQEFIKRLNDAQELMLKEKYKEAIAVLDQLKQIEKNGDFDYNLTHKLYQLDSNSHSLYNQQIILKVLLTLSKKKESISLFELSQDLKENEDLDLEKSILRREIEILILRSLITAKIEGDLLLF